MIKRKLYFLFLRFLRWFFTLLWKTIKLKRRIISIIKRRSPMSIDEALEFLKKEFPEHVPDEVFDFDKYNYLITAPYHGERDFNDPFFLVDKLDGTVEQINPFTYHKKFLNALRNGLIVSLRD